MTWFLLTAVLWAVSYLLVTQGVTSLSPAALLAARGVGAVVLGAGSWLALRGGPASRKEVASPEAASSQVPASSRAGARGRIAVPKAADLFIVGAVGVGAAAALEVYRRGLFFPSGADALFMLATVPIWAALARLVRGDAAAREALLASLFLLAANGIILANWERPSTFAPFALFPASEAALLGSAALWAIGGVEAERRLAGRPVLERTAAAGLGAGWLLVLLPFAATAQAASGHAMELGILVAIAMVSGAALTLAWHDSVAKIGAQAAAFACGAAPVVLTAYVFVERRYGTEHGPVPLVAAPVAAGCALAACAIAAGVLAGRGRGAAPNPGSATPFALEGVALAGASGGPTAVWGVRKTVSALLGALSAVAATAGLILPSVRIAIESQPEVGSFSAAWESGGFATVGGAVAVLCAASAFLAPASRRRDVAWGVLLVAAGIAVIWGGFSQWSAHYSWLPANVLQALGSPYVLLTETPLANPGILAAPWLALAAWAARYRPFDERGGASLP